MLLPGRGARNNLPALHNHLGGAWRQLGMATARAGLPALDLPGCVPALDLQTYLPALGLPGRVQDMRGSLCHNTPERVSRLRAMAGTKWQHRPRKAKAAPEQGKLFVLAGSYWGLVFKSLPRSYSGTCYSPPLHTQSPAGGMCSWRCSRAYKKVHMDLKMWDWIFKDVGLLARSHWIFTSVIAWISGAAWCPSFETWAGLQLGLAISFCIVKEQRAQNKRLCLALTPQHVPSGLSAPSANTRHLLETIVLLLWGERRLDRAGEWQKPLLHPQATWLEIWLGVKVNSSAAATRQGQESPSTGLFL